MVTLCPERVMPRPRSPSSASCELRPLWWREVALIAFGYALYTITRNAAPLHLATAQHHASAVHHVERWLHIDVELSLNRLLSRHELIGVIASYYYATLHFAVTLAVLCWVYRFHPEAYRRARTVLVGSTLVALFVFWVYPLAPPRLAGLGFADTVDSVRLWGGASWSSPGVASVSNEYAAMPSLHVAWSVWSAAVVIWLARGRAVRSVVGIHPVITVGVVLATANHFVLDAVGALGVLLVPLLGLAFADQPAVRTRLTGLSGTGAGPTSQLRGRPAGPPRRGSPPPGALPLPRSRPDRLDRPADAGQPRAADAAG